MPNSSNKNIAFNEIPPHKKIDINSWVRKTAYTYFSAFQNPTYNFSSKIDITNLYNYSKETNTSIFINLLYVISIALNEIPAFKLRIYKGKVIEYDEIYPAFTVMTKTGQFENCFSSFYKEYKRFYQDALSAINDAKNEDRIKESYNDSPYYNQFFITCVPWLEVTSMVHPIPSNNVECMSVPRIFWDKFHFDKNKERVTINLNITVSHALMDGKHLSDGFNNIIKKLNNIKDTFK